MKPLERLLRPQSIAIIGGGAWCKSVREQLFKAKFKGQVWLVHPKGGLLGDDPVYKTVQGLPKAPDAAFVGINRIDTIKAIDDLATIGAGGAVCFASGFAEVDDGASLNDQLLEAAQDMPILGPNCYGMINALDGALLWPDQHGCNQVDTGVAILTQSSNIAINLTMQSRGLPIAYAITCGNQAQTPQPEIAMALLEDPRVTAIGLHIEGFGDITAWQSFARAAHKKSIPVVAIKIGKSEQAQSAAISHTASLSGQNAGAQALLDRLGIARVDDLPTFLETLKILHAAGPLTSNHIATISCSGGEASLAADLSCNLNLNFPPLNERQTAKLSDALGPKVALANPLDYHTYIWRDNDAMTKAFSAMIDPQIAITMLIVDFPRPDRCDPSDWDCVIDAAIRTRKDTGGVIGVVATLPELLPEQVAEGLLPNGVIPMHGLREALCAVQAAQKPVPVDLDLDLIPVRPNTIGQTLLEAEAKQQLTKYGLKVPSQITTDDLTQTDLGALRFPVALKGIGVAHKTEAGAVKLNLGDLESVMTAGAEISASQFLVEEMVTDEVAELLIGVVLDPAHGFTLTLGAGGTLTELLNDTQNLLIPASAKSIQQALGKLKVHRILTGYRGGPTANTDAIVAAVLSIQDYVIANASHLNEVEVNPLICTPTDAIAVDALIRIAR